MDGNDLGLRCKARSCGSCKTEVGDPFLTFQRPPCTWWPWREGGKKID